MDEQLVLKEILLQLQNQNANFIWFLLIGAITCVVGSYIGSYAKKRGENLATKEDFDSLLRQVTATTLATEEVKAAVSHADWVERESKSSKREKLEEFLHAVYALTGHCTKHCNNYLYTPRQTPLVDEEPSPAPTVELLRALYFDEMHNLVTELMTNTGNLRITAAKGRLAILDSAPEASQVEIIKPFQEKWHQLYEQRLVIVMRIETTCKEIMRTLTSATGERNRQNGTAAPAHTPTN